MIKPKSIHSYHKTNPISLLCWGICMSIKKSNPKKHKAMLKDLMKLEGYIKWLNGVRIKTVVIRKIKIKCVVLQSIKINNSVFP